MSKIVWGIFIIIFGVGLLCSFLGLFDMFSLAGWWTLFIIIPAVVDLFYKKTKLEV